MYKYSYLWNTIVYIILIIISNYSSSTECTDYKYGLECSSTCGKCLNGVKCNHVNGSCPNGCDAGSFSDKCDKGNIIGFEPVSLLLIS